MAGIVVARDIARRTSRSALEDCARANERNDAQANRCRAADRKRNRCNDNPRLSFDPSGLRTCPAPRRGVIHSAGVSRGPERDPDGRRSRNTSRSLRRRRRRPRRNRNPIERRAILRQMITAVSIMMMIASGAAMMIRKEVTRVNAEKTSGATAGRYHHLEHRFW